MIYTPSEELLSALPLNPFTLRIQSLFQIYGTDTAFLRFYADENGGILSVMDGAGVLYLPGELTEEWVAFLSVLSLSSLHTPAKTGEDLAKIYGVPASLGEVLIYKDERPPEQAVIKECKVEHLYALLHSVFSDMPPFDSWYVDFSHRFRHGFLQIAMVEDDEKPISAALTTAMTDRGVLIGSVATLPDYRRKGLAKRCVLSLVREFYGRTVYIEAKNEQALSVYRSMGFEPVGRWAEIHFKN